ncbi:two-component system sensor histidine kinase KdpD [Paenibacillus rhizosphaerae]|uniref:Two-component system sensor histidine kinase KdpD n=1 Tax=Paenibacillus rhizosphaerae TaxID=297318 RepID=A0A839TJE4_9BACL|nr:universal stress protein [Paenibacillus rhizosphaerae]MBB3125469.1 two-component system sensor histidine kinase KdpD [Paenibacillus rhizosphaerae]
MKEFRRKTPEELLHSIMKVHLGRLKIYIGSVSGTGKTYHMLREGHTLKDRGIDVVICAVSTMQRPETIRQVGDLERVPSIHWYKDGVERKDLNLDALIARNPEVVLVDGLAHRNRDGARFPTRFEDIRFLLGHGISVITTVNVYELEGMTELAQKLTGIEVEETAPANTLELADEVRLIDVTPETILERLSNGHFRHGNLDLFERGNLAKLRELALRLVADGVNDSLEKHREEMGLLGPSGAAERILVSTQYHWNGSIYVRRGQQIAKRLSGDLRVVSFVPSKKRLSKEAAAFKRSIMQLVDKVDGVFEEIAISSRRVLPRKLAGYAARHNVTRIVMGHSRQSRWQDLWKGSVVNGLVKRIQNTDLFLVADRAIEEGERILPTRSRRSDESDPYRRLSDTDLEKKIERIRRGKCKVYIGAAPGVGKTYTMLREGNDLLKKGIDVVIGLLETHGRQETLAQVGELETIPRLVTNYGGTKLEEMDVEAILKRNPEVVLVDELAHTNVPGSKHKKRYEDVQDILNAGISVISTMNVQHLESLNDAVEQITGIRVRETVPDSMMRAADEVQLIDVAPGALQERMKEGKIYDPSKIDQALGNFFKLGNLIALRELALREIADDVDERLESWDRREALRGPWRRKEVIFVAVTTSPNAERLIRRGFRIAYRLKAAWFVTYVHENGDIPEQVMKRLAKLKELTNKLSGNFELQRASHHRQFASKLIEMADKYAATQMIIGQSARSFWTKLQKGSVVNGILRHARHMDVLVVADFDPNVKVGDEE